MREIKNFSISFSEISIFLPFAVFLFKFIQVHVMHLKYNILAINNESINW